MKTLRLYFLFLFMGIFLAACASGPEFDSSQVDRAITPKSVVSDIKNTQGKSVIWGGVILSTKNLKDASQVEVLAYPLDSSEIPLRNQDPLGRFIILHSGFLEPATYAQGRMVSVLGSVSQIRTGKVGDTDYTYPVINSKQLHLWSKDSGENKTRFHFGIGVRL
ncbi:MAG: Slp family lipoprotein [Gammaproteobacteria bacterium]|nr:Slp family lipoprotein [Gammaproteobacteria bacterium]